jgi:hypothetical protein
MERGTKEENDGTRNKNIRIINKLTKKEKTKLRWNDMAIFYD